ncbi:MAG: homoserine/homoserine lactone efflux protein [Candidatus Sedimenticola sp. 20ELBAFRAG]
MTPELWLAFFIASVLISVSPGAGAVNTMSNGMHYGVRNTLPSILGLQLGYGIQIVIVGVGLGALLASSNLAFSIVKWLGVAYLVWLGYSKWRQPPLQLDMKAGGDTRNQRRFWEATFVNLTNPKATVFLLALFPQFIEPEAVQATQFFIMGLTLILVDVGVMIGYASLASGLSRWMKEERHQRWQNRVFGSLFMGAAALMATYRNGQ